MRAARGALTALVGFSLAVAGCFTSPENCHDCRPGGLDAATDSVGVAGHVGGVGGAVGSGGAIGTGGTVGAGGTTGTGGVVGTGGARVGDAGIGVGGMGVGGMGIGGAIVGVGGMGVGGMGVGGAGVGGMGTGGMIDVALVAWYQLDDATGTSAVDSSGHARTATLSSLGTGSAAFSTTHQVGTGSLSLTSSDSINGGFVTVPASLQTMGATTAITISCWVNVKAARIWQRVFDFGASSTTTYMFLTTHEAATMPNAPRFAITTGGNTGEQMINMTTPAALSLNVWHHLAVVLAASAGATYTGTLYVDKVAAGTNMAMTLRPSSLANTVNNWIGRSQFAVDALFDGQIDDFRVYARALSAAEITALP